MTIAALAPAPGVADSAGAATGIACGCLGASSRTGAGMCGWDMAATDRLRVPGALVVAVDDCDIVDTFKGADVVLEAGVDVLEARSVAARGPWD